MPWILRHTNVPWWRRCFAAILRAGPIPQHVAIIMDGNRRYAKRNSLERAEGHLKGFDKMAEALDWCLDLGISEVTVYAFSIENFNRTKDEVDGLMELARSKFLQLREERDKLDEYGICIRVWGNISLLPEDIQQIVAEVVKMTSNNKRVYFNVCLAYTARDDMCTAMKEIAEGVKLGLLQTSDITPSLLENCLYSGGSAPLDMLIRTSGEVRLSDFLLWQSSYSVLSFVEVLWPDFSIWHLYAGILHYQRHIGTVKKAKSGDNKDQENESLIDDSPIQHPNEKRVKQFLQYLSTKRQNFIDSIYNPLLLNI